MLGGLYTHECTCEEYKGNRIILHVQAKERIRCCPSCGARSIVKNGYRLRDFVGLPIGGKRVTIRMKVQRYKCKECDFDQQEKIPFATNSCSYTHRFAKYVVDLLRGMTLQDVSNHLGVSWDTIKEIHSSYLERHYSPPSLDGVENIGIDEFAVKKGHVYKTIVVDLDSGRVIYVGEGKGTKALKKFWRKVKRKNIKIKHVATDLSAAFIASVMENCPDAVHLFDHFHVVKLMNEKLDDIRRKVYSMEKDINKRKVLKGTRYLLLGNGEDIFDKQHKTRLENALAMNEPLSKAYYLKEQLRQIWSQPTKDMAEKVLDDWIRQAEQSKIAQLQKMAVTVKTYKKGILAWYDCHLSTGKVEGINNKIKVMKRNAYGFRDERYFTLRLYALHDCRITRNVG
ncbi:ISL3 family transposase [Prevotella pallens]|uniref:ISL3 family transposase n=1 Tax=Prevotella pallens TaxID=60133 RepID=UPI0028EE3121|nr:ISL3 family transposase [Prevotella pallens]